MHPNAAFRIDDRQLQETLVREVGFGMVFAATADGPRVAHTPLHYTGDGAVQFHVARGNALAPHLEGQTALVVVNGPDAYVSPRWYAGEGQVPTWNYIALELEGRVRRMDETGLLGLLEDLSASNESRLPGEPWTIDKVPVPKLRAMIGAIVGFELEVLAWRPTLKLSQNKPADERARVADALEANGSVAIARLMRTLAA